MDGKPTMPGFYWVRSKYLNPEKWIVVEYRIKEENEWGDVLPTGVFCAGDEVGKKPEDYQDWIGPLQPPKQAGGGSDG